jgi:hypothetical protein
MSYKDLSPAQEVLHCEFFLKILYEHGAFSSIKSHVEKIKPMYKNLLSTASIYTLQVLIPLLPQYE